MKVFLFLLLFIYQPVSAQLLCKTKTLVNDTIVKTCFHLNKKASSIEIWDRDHRWGNMIGFNNQGIEIFNYGLRSFAGHASVYLTYYPNGQVKKAEYRSAPDGGIQFYHIIHDFDEQGKQTNYVDLSQPDGHPRLIEIYNPKEKPTTPKIEKLPEVIQCAIPYKSVYKVKNRSGKSVLVLMKAKANQWVKMPDTLLKLKANQEALAHSIIMAEKHLEGNMCYEPILINKKGGKSKFKIISAEPDIQSTTKTYFWYVVKE